MKTVLIIALIPALFILCLYGAFLTGEWWDGLVGYTSDSETASPGVLIGFLAFFAYAASGAFILTSVHDLIGKKK